MKSRATSIHSAALAALLWCGLLLGGAALDVARADDAADDAADAADESSLPLETLRVFAEVFGKIKSEYVDPSDDDALLRDAIEGMLAGLDPHSVLLGAEAFKEMRITTDGEFGGLGLEVVVEGGFIKVVAPIDDTPAHRAGIRAGDVIMRLDGAPTRGMGIREAVDLLRGEPGTEIVLSLAREGENELIEVTLVRAIIKTASVKSEMLEDGFGYIRITSFQLGTGASLRVAIESLRASESGLNGLVLDLRNNPGGVLGGAIEVSDAFLDHGLIVSTRGRNADADHAFSASARDLTDDAPMVVLVNGGSASAAEIVAGALQDHRRAIILGTSTFGKGSVQSVIPTEDGGALKLTTARYYTPSDRSIQARGIVPDIVVAPRRVNVNSDGDEPASDEFALSKHVRESDLAGHLANERDDDGDDAPPARGLAARDHQVGEALKLLKGMS
ncbi:MAG: S41 family peptidase, partial [bacterium]